MAQSPSKKPTVKAQRLPPLPPEVIGLYIKLQVPKQDWRLPSGLIIAFAHSLVVPAGKFVNQPLRLRPFQMEFIRDVYNPRNPNGLRKRKQAVLSIGRRGGKTLLAAVIVLVHLAGPLKRINSTIVSAATTRDQASLVYRYVRDMIRVNTALRSRLKIIESVKRVTHLNDFSVYHAISADAGGSFGQGIDLVIYDEMAQAKSRALYDALMTSLGSQIDPLMMIISTQAPSDAHLLSELIDLGLKIKDGIVEDDGSFTVHLYTAPMDLPLDDKKGWFAANPTLGDYRDMEEFEQTIHRAMKVPSLEASIRNLYLNQRVQAKAPFLTPSVWKLNEGEVNDALFHDGDHRVFGGLDLSARTDLSALVWAVEDDEGIVHLKCRVWTPQDTLFERAARDRAPYQAWVADDKMIPVPGAALDYDFIATDIANETEDMPGLGNIAYDPWRIAILKQSFDRIGAAVPLVEMGQGYKAISPCIDVFEELAVSGKLRHGGHPALRWCISNAVITRDAADNRKLDKSKAFGRIDVAQAAVMAVGAMKVKTDTILDVAAMIG
jgi:phage terminase large subunit-like protein